MLTFLVSGCKDTSPTAQSDRLVNKEAAQKMLTSGKVIPIDVRTPEEIAEGKIEGALEIDFKGSGFQSKVSKLDKSATYLVYCRSGRRSAKAVKQMEAIGFEKCYDLDGGYLAWQKQRN